MFISRLWQQLRLAMTSSHQLWRPKHNYNQPIKPCRSSFTLMSLLGLQAWQLTDFGEHNGAQCAIIMDVHIHVCSCKSTYNSSKSNLSYDQLLIPAVNLVYSFGTVLVRRSYPFFTSAVRCEVINRDFDAFSFLQLSEDGDQQLKVEGIRVVKVILVLGCELLLFFIQHLTHKHKVTFSFNLMYF